MAKWRLAELFTIVCLSSSVNLSVDGTAGGPDEKPKMAAVIGGQEFAEGKWPWMASLQGKIPKLMLFGIPILYERLYCGATLLNDRWILTAAHCFPIEQRGYRAVIPRYWHIRLGGRKLSSSLKHRLRGYFGRLLNIDMWKQWYIHGEKIFIHPEYDAGSTWQNDIALVKLREAVPVSEELLPEIQSVTLPERNDTLFPADGARCIMVGWGCTARGGHVSSIAHEAILPKIPDDVCGRFWNVSTNARLCAGYNLAHKGICRGDSGGPLMCRREDKWVQVGIASFTSKNNPGGVPAAFTRVSPYIDWINDTIREN